MALQPISGLGLLFIRFGKSYPDRQLVELLELVISPSQGHYLHRTTQTQNKRRQTSMPLVGFKPTIPVFKRAKIFHKNLLRPYPQFLLVTP
jgi:hypothetical protein